MKKLFTILGIVTFMVTVSAQTNVLTEGFVYTDGTILSTNNTTTGWFQHSGTQGQVTVTGGKAILVSAQTEDINKALSTVYPLNTANSTCKIMYSGDITVTNSTGLAAAGDYMLSLGGTTTTVNTTTGISALPAKFYVKPGTTGYLLGVLNNAGGTVTPTFSTTEIPYGTSAHFAVTYTVDNASTVVQTATLQIDSQPLLTNATGTTTAPAQAASLAIRQGTSTGNVTLDNLSVVTYPAALLAVSDIKVVNSYFVKNTLVNNEISFGAKSDVKVYNMNGQVVKSANVSENKNLNVAELQNGIYLVTGTVNGEAVSQRILKK